MRELLAVAVLLLAGCKTPPPSAEEPHEAREEREAHELLAADNLRVKNGPPVTGEPREFPFVHMETTGITSNLIGPDGRTIAIRFSGDSNQESISALNALAVPVLFPNVTKHNIVVIGVLENVVLHTPSHSRLADSEPYQRFRLTNWYLRAPFIRWSHEPMPDDMDPEVTLDTQLRPQDFREPVSGDLSRFVRQ